MSPKDSNCGSPSCLVEQLKETFVQLLTGHSELIKRLLEANERLLISKLEEVSRRLDELVVNRKEEMDKVWERLRLLESGKLDRIIEGTDGQLDIAEIVQYTKRSRNIVWKVAVAVVGALLLVGIVFLVLMMISHALEAEKALKVVG